MMNHAFTLSSLHYINDYVVPFTVCPSPLWTGTQRRGKFYCHYMKQDGNRRMASDGTEYIVGPNGQWVNLTKRNSKR